MLTVTILAAWLLLLALYVARQATRPHVHYPHPPVARGGDNQWPVVRKDAA